MEIREETTWETILEVIDLGEHHYNEVEAKSFKVPYKLDKKMANMLYLHNMLSIIVARDGEELVGYHASLISPDMFTSSLISKEIGIYVKPEYRRQGLFTEMRIASENEARERGCSLISFSLKTGHNEQVAEGTGYEPTETVWQKVLW
jgi:GNAT superfamily N-acetyltransferase